LRHDRGQRNEHRHLDRHEHRGHVPHLPGDLGVPVPRRVELCGTGDPVSVLRSERGFMLTELLIACVMTVAILGTAVGVFAKFANEQSRSERQGRAEDTARQVLDRMSTDLRDAMSDGSTGSQPVEVHTSTDLVYLAPSSSANLTNNPRGLQHTRYCLDTSNAQNEVLWYQTISYDSVSHKTAPSASSCPGSAYTTQEAVATNIVNQVGSQP